MTQPGHVYICRHGQTEWNAAGRMQGEGDAPLTDLGREQAANLGHALKALGVQRIFCSPLGRARASASIAAEIADIEVELDGLLAEMRFGECSGLTREQIDAAYPGLLATRERDKWHVQWPGGESYADVFARTAGVAQRYAYAASQGQTVVSLAHETVNKCLLAHLLKLDQATLMRLKHYNKHIFRLTGEAVQHADATTLPLQWSQGLVFLDGGVL